MEWAVFAKPNRHLSVDSPANLAMARIRKILRDPTPNRNYFLIDANVLARKHIPAKLIPVGPDRDRVAACHEWWKEIDAQLNSGCARVYIPDVCIAEAFKVLASWYYVSKWFKTPVSLKTARDRLSKDIRTDSKALRTTFRPVRYHDISTNRDIIISVDRFFETFMKHRKNCSVPDLIIAATAKYLREFYDIPREFLHIVTMDRALREGIAKVPELPKAYDPSLAQHAAKRIFA
jgi:predicted nucleic acid-binding protein